MLRLSCVVRGPIYGRIMDCTVNGFLSICRFTKVGDSSEAARWIHRRKTAVFFTLPPTTPPPPRSLKRFDTHKRWQPVTQSVDLDDLTQK